MSTPIATFQAKCGSCGQLFAHPSLGDQAYGEALLCAKDGSAYASVSAFSDMPQRIKALVPTATAEEFWNAVATLADPINGQGLTARIRCPACSSERLEFWEGERVGNAEVEDATFRGIESLSPPVLRQLIAGRAKEIENNRKGH